MKLKDMKKISKAKRILKEEQIDREAREQNLRLPFEENNQEIIIDVDYPEKKPS
jgi:hypothetical protein